MTRIAIAGAQPDLEQLIAHVTGGAYLALSEELSTDPSVILSRLNGALLPEILIVDSRSDVETALALAEQFDQDHPEIIVLMATDRATELGLSAMRAGVRDLISVDEGVEEVHHALAAAVATLARVPVPTPQTEPSPRPTGRVITVVSSKGGAGKTTLTTNIAVGLARTLMHSTVIVDLDLQFGDVATALNIAPEFSLVDALPSIARRDSISLKSYLTMHDTSLYVLPAPEHPAGADAVTSEQVSNLLQMLASEFQYVIVDTAPGLSDLTLAALDNTTDPLLLTTMNVTGMRGMTKVVDTLKQLQMFSNHHQHAVLNFADSSNGLTKRDVEDAFGGPISITIPTSKSVPPSSNLGVPIMQTRTRDPLAKAIAPLVNRFLPEGIEVNRRGRHRDVKAAR